jgi:hypothetical protein
MHDDHGQQQHTTAFDGRADLFAQASKGGARTQATYLRRLWADTGSETLQSRLVATAFEWRSLADEIEAVLNHGECSYDDGMQIEQRRQTVAAKHEALVEEYFQTRWPQHCTPEEQEKHRRELAELNERATKREAKRAAERAAARNDPEEARRQRECREERLAVGTIKHALKQYVWERHRHKDSQWRQREFTRLYALEPLNEQSGKQPSEQPTEQSSEQPSELQPSEHKAGAGWVAGWEARGWAAGCWAGARAGPGSGKCGKCGKPLGVVGRRPMARSWWADSSSRLRRLPALSTPPALSPLLSPLSPRFGYIWCAWCVAKSAKSEGAGSSENNLFASKAPKCPHLFVSHCSR